MIGYRELTKKIDSQHKMLAKILANMEKAQDQPAHGEAVSEALNAMIECAINHFKTEESAMKETNYPGMDQHIQQHRNFLEKTTGFCVDRTLNKSISSVEIIEYLRNWLSGHHEYEDVKMEQYLRKYTNSSDSGC